MAQQHCRDVLKKMEALLSDPAPHNTITPGLVQKYGAVSTAISNCFKIAPWGYSAVKRLVKEKVSMATYVHMLAVAACCQPAALLRVDAVQLSQQQL